MINISTFQEFFNCCVGKWQTERTYHYLSHQEIERSRTEFYINPLTSELKQKVLTDNQYSIPENLDICPGYHLEFYTISEKGEEVSQSLNLLFVPQQEHDDCLEGDYLRDRAYEEARPILSHFRFQSSTRELLMRTNYTRVVSVDSITLINPQFRIRKIINYLRPSEDQQPLEIVNLVGFGVEQKVI